MDLSNKELVKSLTSLIDDTLQEIEEIKKSKFYLLFYSRFSGAWHTICND